MDASKQRRKGQGYRVRPTHVLLLGLLLLGLVLLALLIFLGVKLREPGGMAAPRKLVERHDADIIHVANWTTTEQLPNPPAYKHAFLVLDPGPNPEINPKAGFWASSTNPEPIPALTDIRTALEAYRQHPEAISVVDVHGAAAASLAAQFLLSPSDLPAVVYVPPMHETGGEFRGVTAFTPIARGAGVGEETRTANEPRPQGQGGTAGEGGEEDIFNVTVTRDVSNAFESWVKKSARMTLLFEVDWDTEADVCFYFVRGPGDEIELTCPQAKTEEWQLAGLLDRFVARSKTSHAVLAEYTALFSGIFTVHPPNWCHYLRDRGCELEKYEIITDPQVLNQRNATELQRVGLMAVQPKSEPKYTPTGFDKKRCPFALYQALSGYLNASWEQVIRERRTLDNTYANDVEAPTLHVPLPEVGPLKPRLFNMAYEELSNWINRATPLVPTALYGIRVYTNKSTLAMHVDRWDTHVVSAIINVDQDTARPWPLQITDHAGKVHSVVMAPGDMVMYEGAACAHGRVEPLDGRFFANVFVHFRPEQINYPPPHMD